MAKGYWIVDLNVTDPDQYGEYVKLVRPFLASLGAKFLVRGGEHKVVEGDRHPRSVVVEFAGYAAAVEAYNCPEYQEMIKIRTSGSVGNFVIAEGLDA